MVQVRLGPFSLFCADRLTGGFDIILFLGEAEAPLVDRESPPTCYFWPAVPEGGSGSRAHPALSSCLRRGKEGFEREGHDSGGAFRHRRVGLFLMLKVHCDAFFRS